jgi:glycosyltransferase involved in cell wall biosynthesis
MKLAILFGGICLSFRKTMEFAELWKDPRGLTGSELGAVRIAEECAAMGHDTTLFTVSPDKEWHGVKIANLADGIPEGFDAAIAINEPDLLRAVPPSTFRATAFWLNGFTHCQPGFVPHCDLYFSPSEPHMHETRTRPEWHRVAPNPSHPDGQERYEPDPARWVVVPLGCDPERYLGECCAWSGIEDGEPYEGEPLVQSAWWDPRAGNGAGPTIQKIPGRCIYSSSPDRGLHWLLQEWPAIKRAVPHATLHVFYRLEPWIRGFDATPYFPPIEPNRARALYVQEALRRLSDPKWGITLRDSVSRETIEREMAQAEVMAYPCDTLSWSEGFSCSLLEGCAARACPVTTDCDALGEVYGGVAAMAQRNGREPKEWVPDWRATVIRALTDATFRDEVNTRARAFAEKLTWRRVAETYVAEIQKRTAAKEAA